MLRPKKYFDVARMVQNQAAHHDRADRQHEAAVGGSTIMKAKGASVTTILSPYIRSSSLRLLRTLWMRIVFHLPGILEEDNGFPDVVVRENTIPTGHGGITNAVLDHVEEIAIGIIGCAAHELRHRRIELCAQGRSWLFQAAVATGTVLVVGHGAVHDVVHRRLKRVVLLGGVLIHPLVK